MKIALCLHGYFDSLQDPTSLGINGYNYIKKHILDKGDVDVFIHSWDWRRMDEINGLYKPTACLYQPQIDFSPTVEMLGIDKLQWKARKPENVLSHFFSIQKSFELLYSCKDEYDIIIKSRFDLGQINRNTSGPGKGNPYPVQCIDFNPNFDMSKLYMANWGMMDQGPPDMWFYSNRIMMMPFMNIYDRVRAYLTNGSDYINYHLVNTHEVEISNSVRLYKWWMQKNEMWNYRCPINSEWE